MARFVGAAPANELSSPSLTQVITYTPTVGNTVFVLAGYNNALTGVADNASPPNVFGAIGPTLTDPGTGWIKQWYAATIVHAGATATTLTFSGMVSGIIALLLEESGALVLDGTGISGAGANGASGTGTLADSGAITLVNSNDTLIGFFQQGTIDGNDHGFTTRVDFNFGVAAAKDQDLVSSSTIHAQATCASGAWLALAIAVTPSGGSVPAPLGRSLFMMPVT